jgi:hypothetical protein
VSCIARQQWQGVYQQDRSTGEFSPQGFKFDFSTLPDFDSQSSDRLVSDLWKPKISIALVVITLFVSMFVIPAIVLAFQRV